MTGRLVFTLAALALLAAACSQSSVGDPVLPGAVDEAVPSGATIQHYGDPADLGLSTSTLTPSGVLIEHHHVAWFTLSPDRATAFVERLLAEMAAEGWENDFSPQMEAGRTLDFYWRPLDGIDPDDQRDDIAVGVIRNDDTHLIMLSHGMRTLPGTDTE